jgi:hypothetical protein
MSNNLKHAKKSKYIINLITSISYINIPSVHQSTALVCPHPLITTKNNSLDM